jgi:DinB superfamily
MPNPPPSLTPAEAAALLRASAEAFRREAEALGDDGVRWHPAEGEWCVNEVMGHMIEAERRGFAGRIRLMIEQPGRELETWDQAQVARDRDDCERDGTALLREFASLREESVRLVLSLTPEQLALSAGHPEVGELRVSDIVHEWVFHDRNHLKQALSIAQARVWPHMRNTQRF